MPSKAHGRAAKRSAGGDVGDFSADIPGAGAGGSEREVGCSGLSAVHRNALRAVAEAGGAGRNRVSTGCHIRQGVGAGG